jgi:hypothetical protein
MAIVVSECLIEFVPVHATVATSASWGARVLVAVPAELEVVLGLNDTPAARPVDILIRKFDGRHIIHSAVQVPFFVHAPNDADAFASAKFAGVLRGPVDFQFADFAGIIVRSVKPELTAFGPERAQCFSERGIRFEKGLNPVIMIQIDSDKIVTVTAQLDGKVATHFDLLTEQGKIIRLSPIVLVQALPRCHRLFGSSVTRH